MLRKLLVLIVALLTLPVLAQLSAANFPSEAILQRIRPEGIRAHMDFLASDLLEGRATGTRGYALAASYIQTQFEEMGLRAAGNNGTYLQNVPFRRIELIPEQSSVTVQNGANAQKLVFEKDFVSRGDPLYPDAVVQAKGVEGDVRHRANLRVGRDKDAGRVPHRRSWQGRGVCLP